MTTTEIVKPKARRDVVKAMRWIASQMHDSIGRWTTQATGKIYDRGLGQPSRPRRADERPENQRAAWERLAMDMSEVISMANTVRQYAHDMVELIDTLERKGSR